MSNKPETTNFLKRFISHYNGSSEENVLTTRSNWYATLTFEGLANIQPFISTFNYFIQNFGLYISDIDIKNLQQKSTNYNSNETINEVGTYHGVGLGSKVQPASLNDLGITFFETDVSIVDTFIYHWLINTSKINTNDTNIYPHLRGKLIIYIYNQFASEVITEYHINGIYPWYIDLIKFDYNSNKLSTRRVSFKYNNIQIFTKYNANESIKDELFKIGFRKIHEEIEKNKDKIKMNEENMKYRIV